MMEPKRLFDGGGSELEQLLVSAGRMSRPSRIARWRAGVRFSTAQLELAARSVLRPSERRWGAGRWVLVGVTTTALAWGTAHQTREYIARRSSANQAQAMEVTSPSTERAKLREGNEASTRARVEALPAVPLAALTAPAMAVPPATAPTTTAHPATAVPPSARVSATRGGSTVAARSIAREVEELDRVRRLVAAGDTGRALERLDGYGKAFPAGALQQEAILLRAEALLAGGERERARKVAQRALALFPQSAHAQRFQTIADMH